LETSLPEAREGRQLRFLFLPDGHDPDSLVRQEGRDAFEQRLGSALLLSEYLVQELAVRCDLAHAEGRTRFIAEAQELLARVPDDVYRERLFERMAAALGLSPDRLLRAVSVPFKTPAVTVAAKSAHSSEVNSVGRGSLVRQTIQNLLHFPQAAAVLQTVDALRRLEKPGMPLLIELIELLQAQPDLSPAALLERWRSREEFQYIDKLFLKGPVAVDLVTAKDEVKKAVERMIAEEFPQQRFDELMQGFHLGALSEADKQELRDLTRRRTTR
jgi:DNA primase